MCYWKKCFRRTYRVCFSWRSPEHALELHCEIEFASIEDQLSMHRTASNETTLASNIQNIINEENVKKKKENSLMLLLHQGKERNELQF